MVTQVGLYSGCTHANRMGGSGISRGNVAKNDASLVAIGALMGADIFRMIKKICNWLSVRRARNNFGRGLLQEILNGIGGSFIVDGTLRAARYQGKPIAGKNEIF